MEQLGFDYVFYQDPYNVHYPKEICSKSVVKYSKICYIPYGYVISPNFSDLLLQNKDFFRNVSVFLLIVHQKEMLCEKYLEKIITEEYKKFRN